MYHFVSFMPCFLLLFPGHHLIPSHILLPFFHEDFLYSLFRDVHNLVSLITFLLSRTSPCC